MSETDIKTQKNRSGQRIQHNSYLEKNREREEKRSRRAAVIVTAVLCAALPPLGLLLAWHSRRMEAPVRIALSLVGLATMTLALWLWMRSGRVDLGLMPVPVVPMYAGYDVAAIEPTPVPVEVVNVSPVNGPSTFTVTYGDGTVDDLTAASGLIVGEGGLPVDPATYVTIVYAVTNNATRFHTLQVCDFQTNSRVLTLDEALAEGLLPCEKCAQEYIKAVD